MIISMNTSVSDMDQVSFLLCDTHNQGNKRKKKGKTGAERIGVKKIKDQSSNRQPEFQRTTCEHEVGVGKGQVSGHHDKRLAMDKLWTLRGGRLGGGEETVGVSVPGVLRAVLLH